MIKIKIIIFSNKQPYANVYDVIYFDFVLDNATNYCCLPIQLIMPLNNKIIIIGQDVDLLMLGLLS
jgi:hypothetical protein